MNRKIKNHFIFICMLLLLFYCSVDAFAVEEPIIKAKAALLISGDTGETIFSYNEDASLYPASTVKILTSMLIIEACEDGAISYDDTVVITKDILDSVPWDASSMEIPLVEEEKISIKNLLYANMLSSDCRASSALGVFLSGSMDAFTELMNNRSEELGCKNCNFTNASGYPDEKMAVTASDLAFIAQNAMQYDVFRQICSTVTYEMPATNKSPKRMLINSNRLIINPENSDFKDSEYGKVFENSNTYFYDKAIGIKTGTSDDSGYCLVAAAQSDADYFISVVLGSKAEKLSSGETVLNQYTTSINLLDYGFAVREEIRENQKAELSELKSEKDAEYRLNLDSLVQRSFNSVQNFYHRELQAEQNKVTESRALSITACFAVLILSGVSLILFTVIRKRKQI